MFCPENPDKYCCEPTLKYTEENIDDWILLFDAVMRQKPYPIKAEYTIDHANSIRDYAKAVKKSLRT